MAEMFILSGFIVKKDCNISYCVIYFEGSRFFGGMLSGVIIGEAECILTTGTIPVF